jgi:hypothetical protein
LASLCMYQYRPGDCGVVLFHFMFMLRFLWNYPSVTVTASPSAAAEPFALEKRKCVTFDSSVP